MAYAFFYDLHNNVKKIGTKLKLHVPSGIESVVCQKLLDCIDSYNRVYPFPDYDIRVVTYSSDGNDRRAACYMLDKFHAEYTACSTNTPYAENCRGASVMFDRLYHGLRRVSPNACVEESEEVPSLILTFPNAPHIFRGHDIDRIISTYNDHLPKVPFRVICRDDDDSPELHSRAAKAIQQFFKNCPDLKNDTVDLSNLLEMTVLFAALEDGMKAPVNDLPPDNRAAQTETLSAVDEVAKPLIIKAPEDATEQQIVRVTDLLDYIFLCNQSVGDVSVEKVSDIDITLQQYKAWHQLFVDAKKVAVSHSEPVVLSRLKRDVIARMNERFYDVSKMVQVPSIMVTSRLDARSVNDGEPLDKYGNCYTIVLVDIVDVKGLVALRIENYNRLVRDFLHLVRSSVNTNATAILPKLYDLYQEFGRITGRDPSKDFGLDD